MGRAQSWGRGPVPCDSSVGGLRCEACPLLWCGQLTLGSIMVCHGSALSGDTGLKMTDRASRTPYLHTGVNPASLGPGGRCLGQSLGLKEV